EILSDGKALPEVEPRGVGSTTVPHRAHRLPLIRLVVHAQTLPFARSEGSMNQKAQPTVLTRSIEFDLHPEQVFQNLHRLSGFFFLDSGMANHELSRYSYFGVNPFLTMRSRGNGIDIVEGKSIHHQRGNPLTVLTQLLRDSRITGGSPL